MRARSILTIALAAFIIVAVITIAKQANDARPAAVAVAASSIPPADTPRVAPPPEPTAVAAVPATEAAAVPAENAARVDAVAEGPKPRTERTAPPTPVAAPTPQIRKVVATYFHGNVRCATCRKVEAYAREAIESGFQPQIKAGLVEFRAVNVEQPENRHFIEDFQLMTRSVVVTDEVDGAVQQWVKLDGVWRLVGNRDAYMSYVQDAVRGYLEIR